MTGGGFGGCCLALVRPDAVEQAEQTLADFCRSNVGDGSSVLVTAAGPGAEATT
jgi:galactokinase